jgi:hypothetical protein
MSEAEQDLKQKVAAVSADVMHLLGSLQNTSRALTLMSVSYQEAYGVSINGMNETVTDSMAVMRDTLREVDALDDNLSCLDDISKQVYVNSVNISA